MSVPKIEGIAIGTASDSLRTRVLTCLRSPGSSDPSATRVTGRNGTKAPRPAVSMMRSPGDVGSDSGFSRSISISTTPFATLRQRIEERVKTGARREGGRMRESGMGVLQTSVQEGHFHYIRRPGECHRALDSPGSARAAASLLPRRRPPKGVLASPHPCRRAPGGPTRPVALWHHS
jgi:hypothetical protein